MGHSKEALETELGKWGKKLPSTESMHIALDVSKIRPAIIWLPPRGAKEPLPGDPDRRAVNLRVRSPLEHFHCIIPGCGPLNSAVGTLMTDRRHHFRHKTKQDQGLRPGHDPESIWHKTGKHAFLAWLETQLAGHIVERYLDEHLVETPEGAFEPDIYLALDSGVRIAVEYQHSPGDPVVMFSKRKGYKAAGIVDIWLYGPWAETCKVKEIRNARSLVVAPIPAQINMIQARWPFYWFNPKTEVVGTPLNAGTILVPKGPGEDWADTLPRTVTTYPQHPWPKGKSLSMDLSPLDKCTIEPDTGLFQSPVDARIDSQAKYAQLEIAGLKQQAKARYDQRVAEELAAANAARRAGEEQAEAERVAEELAAANAARRAGEEQEAKSGDQANLGKAGDIPSLPVLPGFRPLQSHAHSVPTASEKPARGWFQRWLQIFRRP